jgi:hypothetical protein
MSLTYSVAESAGQDSVADTAHVRDLPSAGHRLSAVPDIRIEDTAQT